LTLYRRHLKTCRIQQNEKLTPRAKRLYMDCSCPIWMYGNTGNGGFVPRQSTGLTDLKEAEALRASMLADAKDEQVHGPRIDDCIARYLESREHELGSRTMRQHVHLLGLLEKYLAARGIYFTREITVDILENFKVDGLRGLSDTSKGTVVAKLRAFLRDAFRREWILKPLAEQVRGHAAVYEEKEPYTEREITMILEEALHLNGGRNGYSAHPKTFRLLLELMLECGFRVSDAVRFDPSRLIRGEVSWVYPFTMMKRKRTQKPKIIEAYLSDQLKTAIDACKWLSPALPFMYGNQPESAVRERMLIIGERCGVKDCRPHRLRDSFAVRKLLSGKFTLDDVSRLLGHSSVKITEAYYAKWIPARTRRLERLVSDSLSSPSSVDASNY
jgi:integrase/recombinase XerD